ncbi:uncharacterized protein BT62DRAFT_935939 [Guyanagaster necrorhizus]|uniref:Uncharacterized protein n=1 Tax=Guyanagaster necrorhizus TaxID=856835 RepID=A0A9P7VLN8_9AGAR|nr:uncharacterized protein BT62DRAFT_935939 [Guyanagaster necrorhizus MCA 3950]KAG7442635.1 hypothetical protein BT62DRAFT_935939 [Guyanagaster necrorhizus MCA 3950]
MYEAAAEEWKNVTSSNVVYALCPRPLYCPRFKQWYVLSLPELADTPRACTAQNTS